MLDVQETRSNTFAVLFALDILSEGDMYKYSKFVLKDIDPLELKSYSWKYYRKMNAGQDY